MSQQIVYFESGEGELFGCLHQDAEVVQKNCGVVICSPFGFEYTHGYRSFKYLANSLAAKGLPTLRFDYHGVGNSSGSTASTDSLNQLKQDILSSITFLKQSTGVEKICLLGFRLGATLAAELSSKFEVDFLILWAPIVSGKKYARELQLVMMSAEDQSNNKGDGSIDAAGIAMSVTALAELKKINLLEVKLKIKERVLLVNRSEIQGESALFDKLIVDQVATDEITVAGFIKMMDEPHFTEIPKVAIEDISEWLSGHVGKAKQQVTKHSQKNKIQLKNNFEEAHCFGVNKDLFGVLSYLDNPKNDKPIIVLLNAGSVHNVGPHRLYVGLARALAVDGYASFRVDIHGLGESGSLEEQKENDPYGKSAVPDALEALKFLKEVYGQNRFILMGLCSGAHTAFHATIQAGCDYEIVNTVLINPLTFHWKDGMNLEATMNSELKHFHEAAYYKKQSKNLRNWLKFAKGKVKFKSASKFIFQAQLMFIKSLLKSSSKKELVHDLQLFFQKSPKLTLIISETDPGFDLLINGAKSMVIKELKSKRINVHFVKNADHTFSSSIARNTLIENVRNLLKS
jgi:alpha/beta superfamily hydrolase